MVDPNGVPAGLYSDDDENVDDEPSGRLPIKRVAIVSASVAAAALLVSGVFYGPAVVRVLGQSDTTIKSPEHVGAFTLDSSDAAKNTAEYVRDAIATEVNLDDSVGLIYRDQSTSVILVAGTARVWKPARSLQSGFDAVADDAGGVRDLHDVDAGPLGGTVRCGVTKTDDGDLTVCGWADNGSVGVALLPTRSVTDGAKTLLELRTAVEHRD
jgi:hypothetical protein